jgi:hypothetical protein
MILFWLQIGYLLCDVGKLFVAPLVAFTQIEAQVPSMCTAATLKYQLKIPRIILTPKNVNFWIRLSTNNRISARQARLESLTSTKYLALV